jgi:hypothetical protein
MNENTKNTEAIVDSLLEKYITLTKKDDAE